MAVDPLLDVFGGAAADPLSDVFGEPAGGIAKDFSTPPPDIVQEAYRSSFGHPEGVAPAAIEQRSRISRLTARHDDSATDQVSAATPFAASAEAKAFAEAPEFNPGADLVQGGETGWNATLAMMRQNRADFHIAANGATPELLAASKKAKAEAEAINKTVPDSSIAQVGYNIGNLAASMFSSGKQAVDAAGAGAAVGAAGGAVGGPAGAVAGAASGAAIGLTAGFIADSYVTNSGQILGDLREAGVDPHTAKAFGMAGGAIMAGIDLWGIGFAARPFVKIAERRAMQKAIATELEDKLAKGGISAAAKDYLIGIAGESGAETAQQIVQDVTTDLAKQASGGNYETIFNSPKRRHEAAMNAVNTLIATAEGMAVLGVPGMVAEAHPVSGDNLGRAEQPKAPEPGRSYSAADAIAELGMAPDEAVAKYGTTEQKGHLALADHGFTPEITPDDQASTVPTDVIVEGKDILGSALEQFDQPPQAKGLDIADVKARIGHIENATGDPNAKNPLSSASGQFQFTDSTWAALGGDPAKKNDPAEQSRMMDKLLAQNAAALSKAGIQTTGGNLYLAHFLGAQGAINALENPNAEVSAAVQKANPFAQGWSNGQLAAWANRKMGGKPGEWTGNPNLAADRAWAEKDAGADGARLSLTVEDTIKQALGTDDILDDELKPGLRVNVTQNDETVPGTVAEVYGEGADRGARIERDDGTTFDENLSRARQYGARLSHIAEAAAPIDNGESPNVAVPDVAQPQLAGDKINDEWTAFHPDTGTLGIPRADMPQVDGSDRGALVNFLSARGIDHTEETVPATDLKPTQAEFSPQKVASWDKGNVKLEERNLLASSDGHILDGHHQYVKAREQGQNVGILRFNAPIRDLIQHAHAFPSSRRAEGHEGGSQVQPDMFGGEAKTAEQIDAERFAPGIIKRATSDGKLDDLNDAVDYVIRRSEKTSATPGDKAQSVKDLEQVAGRKLNRKEAVALGIELEKQMDRERGFKQIGKNAAGETVLEHEDGRRAYRRRNGEVTEEGRGAEHSGRFLTKGEAAKGEEPKILPGQYRDTKTGETFHIHRVNGDLIEGLGTNGLNSTFGTKPTAAAIQSGRFVRQAEQTDSTAPEHATVGVDDRELGEIVTEFNDAQASMDSADEKITHIFDAPEKKEIVRLNEKSRVYHKDHGWMTPKEAAALIDKWEEHAVQQGKDEKTRSANADRVVLSLFDLSGEWSAPWEQAGYQVFRFDIQADPEVGDVNNFSTDFFGDWFGDFEGKDIYAILAACPCTDFASSGARHFAAKDKDGRTVASVKLVHQTLATIEHFKPAVWALENPVGRIEKLGGLPPWRLSFDPNDLGDPYTKKTLLWGRFNGDLPVAPVEPTEGSKMHKLYGGKSLATKNARSVTPRGFSYGFFMANNAVDHAAMAIANKYDRLDRGLIEQAVKAGVTEDQISEAVDDHYYMDLDDAAANAAIKDLIDRGPEPIADQPTEAPANEAAAEALRSRAEPHQEELAAWGERWQRQGFDFINPGLKSAARIIEKLTKEDYDSLDEIKDIARAGFTVSDRTHGTDLFVSAQRTFGAKNVTDKGWRMVDGDYFDRKLIISWPDGTKAEIQIIPDALEKFRHEGGGSELYTKWRSTEPGPEKDALLRQMEDGYAKAASGTVWESFFNELKSASGNALAASASESEGPGLVANPGAAPQAERLDDQTNAQAPLPETAPEATNLSSTSKSENSATTADVGNAGQVGNVSEGIVGDPAEAGRAAARTGQPRFLNFNGSNPRSRERAGEWYRAYDSEQRKIADEKRVLKAQAKDYGANNKIVTRDQADIARAIIRNKLKNQLNSGFDPELLSAGMQIAAFHLEAGARKFADFTKAVADDLGTQAIKLKPYLAAWYNGARDMLEAHGADVSDMDEPAAVKAGITALAEPTTVDDIGDNGGENGSVATDQGIEGADRAGDAREEPGNAPGAEGERGAGQGSDQPGEPGAGQLPGREGPGGGERPVGEAEPAASGTGERDVAGLQRSSRGGAEPSSRVRADANGANFRASAGSLKREGSWLATANRNLDIIELVNKLDAEARPATPDEQKLLAKWTGWGASEIRNKLFASVDRKARTINTPYYMGEWQKTVERARELLTGDDLETALQSVQYAHYTSEGIVRGIWDAMQRLGFDGGRILEPGMGIGHFFTAAPESIYSHSNYTGIELDRFSAKVARYLLPNENIIQGDYTERAFPDGFFDAAIGNPPFANIKVLNDPAYKKMRLSLHNYFFVKSLDKVRPGGIVSFITSRYTMDALDPKQRQLMADRADFIGAIRLPQTAFKENAGTEVATDVLFFQRRTPGVEPAGEQWLATKHVSVGGKKQAINQYFADHPEMVLGKHSTKGTMYASDSYTVEPFASKGTIEKQFGEAVARLPQGIYTAAVKAANAKAEAKTFERDFAPSSSKEGGLYVKDGKVLVVDRGSGVPVEAVHEKVRPGDHAWLKGYVKLRDLMKDAQKAQLEDSSEWEQHLDALRAEYRKFTKANGRIREFTVTERKVAEDAEEGDEGAYLNKKGEWVVGVMRPFRRYKWSRLLFDIESPLVESLETITDAGDIEDGPFLKGRTLNKPVRPKIETVSDALAVTLDEVGKLDLEYLSKLYGKDRDAVVEELGDRIYQTPGGEWQTNDEYLSGNVLQKLEEAQAAAKLAPELQRNVEALLKVQPKPLSYDRITVKLGMPWVKPETVQQFADEVLGQGSVPITYEPTTAAWDVEGAKKRFRRNVTEDYGTADRSPLELLDAVLNNRTIKVTRKVDKKDVVDADATAAANEAAKKISDRFKTWMWEDSARTSEYVDIYNRSYNNISPREFNGDHLTLPGLSTNFKPHPHVKRAVWRIIQTGNTYLAHAVGAGKTAEQIIGAQEQRRLGLIRKPMHVVPNHMLKQFQQEFLQLYPAANLMVADEQAFHTGNRRRFLAQAALNDPDAIIITHSGFGKIDTSLEMRAAVLDEMIDEMESALKDMKGTDAPRHNVKDLENRIEGLKKRFAGDVGAGKDKLLTFDQMGVDFLLIDEAHEFRKLDFATNRNAKGITPKGSARALDLFIKSQWLESRNPGRSMVLASGTPVTNTMAELYTVMRYLSLAELKKDGISAFDAWANMFGEVVPGYERNAAGGYEIVDRFSKFVNVPELMKRVRNFMDVLTSAQLGDLVKRPKIKDGGPQNILAPVSDELDDYMKGELETRLKTSREWKPSPAQPNNPDPVINIITDARLAAIDMRYIRPGLKSDPESKLNQMIAQIAADYHATASIEYPTRDGGTQPRKGAAQIVFSPVGFGEQVAKNRGFDVRGWIDGELVRLGVKKSEIGWMSDANTHAKKDQLQKDVRSGKTRILIGSPKNMGTGLNVQDRLISLHFLAPPWFPADVTQPHGRIERQGNLNDEIGIKWYATKGTYDSTGWGMVARKQKFIDDAMAGDDSVRTLDDISEVNQFEMAAALAAGDDRVIRIAALNGEVERLTRLKGAHATTQRTLRSDIETLEQFELPRLEKRQAALKAAQDARGGYTPFSLTVAGQEFDKHGEAGAALKAAAQKAVDSTTALEKTEIGKLYGKFPVSIDSTRHGDFQLSVDVGGTPFEAGRAFESVDSLDDVGIIRSIEAAVQRIPSDLQEVGRQIGQANDQLTASKRKYGAPFPEEQQLSEAIAERGQLQNEMAEETKAKDKPQASALASAEMPQFEISDEKQQEILEETIKQVQALLPAHSMTVKVGKTIDIDGQAVEGYYWQRTIGLAAAITRNRPWVVAHESVHAAKAIGLFTPPEWNILVREAWTNRPANQEAIRERWAGRGLTEEQFKEEAVAELFAEHHDLMNPRGKPWLVRLFRRFINFMASVVHAYAKVTGNTREADAIVAHRVMELMRTGQIGSRPEGFGEEPKDQAEADNPLNPNNPDIRASVAEPISPASPDFGGDSERRWQEAKKGIGSGPSVIEKASAWWDDLTGGFTRHWRALPNIARFADVAQQLRKLEAAPHAASTEAVRQLRSLVGEMDAKEYDLFARKVVLDDLAWDAGEGRELPFGFTPSSLKDARANIDAQVNLSPKLVRAIRARKAYNAKVADAMVEAGVLTADQIKNPAYFRHMVLDYARHEAALARTPNKIKSPYWAKRMGSSLDINANLLEAELDWLQKAQVDIATAKTIEWIKQSGHNQRGQLQQRARTENKAALDKELANNPSARKEDGWLRSNIARGYQIVKDELEAGNMDPVPAHLRGMANDIVNDKRDGEAPFPLLAWIADAGKSGDMGARMVLKYSGLRKQWVRGLLGDKWADPADIAGLVKRYKPEGMTAWQPKEGRHLFTAKTISESALDMFVSHLADTATPGIDREELARGLGSVRSQLVVGGDRYTMVLPEEIAATLDEFGDRRGEGMVAHVFGGIQSAWKRWVLINPHRFLKYNFNNQTGDLDAIIAGKPSSLRRVPEAWGMLRDASKGKPSARYTEALERGVFQSALSAQEIPDINKLSAFAHLTERSRRPDKLLVKGMGTVWRALQDSTNFRESLFRLAAYLQYADELEGGKDQLKIGYGASIPRIVDAVEDPKDKAALLARDLIGDYGSISVAGSWIRRYLVPFWSWTEINTKRYWRLTSNAFSTSYARGAATGGGLGAVIAARSALALYTRIGALYGLIYLWNHLLFGDDEDDLDDQQKAQLHLLLGRDSDGNVVSIRTQGAFSDVLHTLGFTDAMLALNKWRDGQGSLGSVLTDMVKAPVNRVGTAVTPLISEPIEQALRLELWPDMFQPRVIHDRARHLAQDFSLENEYDALAGKPSRGYAQSWAGSLVYKANPGEMAYDQARSIAYDWLEQNRGERGGASTSPRGEALRDYRLALRYGDHDAATKALGEYEALGGTRKSLKQSVKAAHPLGPIAKKDRKAFLASLTDEQLDTFADAEAYWKDLYAGGGGGEK